MRTLILAASPTANAPRLKELAASAQLIIAADGGASLAIAQGVWPDVVVGDMDSLPHEQLDALRRNGVDVLTVPAAKNETDLELALGEAVKRGATDITILGALGGRLDHTVGNLYLLTMPELRQRKVRLVDANVEALVISDSAILQGKAQDLVSLIPLTPEVSGIETEGLEYPLRGESLFMGPGRGISNRMLGERARLSIGDGLLLAILIHDPEEVESP